MVTVRPATLDDLAAITEIYNDAVLNLTATFDTDPKSMEDQREWFAHHDNRHPILVAERGDSHEIVGWASLSQWSDRCAYEDTAENSIYVKASCRGQGIGKALLAALIAQGATAGIHTIIARIGGSNAASVRLHESQGFEPIGVMREVGFKFGQRLDVTMMQKIYQP